MTTDRYISHWPTNTSIGSIKLRPNTLTQSLDLYFQNNTVWTLTEKISVDGASSLEPGDFLFECECPEEYWLKYQHSDWLMGTKPFIAHGNEIREPSEIEVEVWKELEMMEYFEKKINK